MPIEMPKGLPFSVDTWTISSTEKRHHFLTHAHMDHLQGISARRSLRIYSTSLTMTLVLQFLPQFDGSNFVAIEIGEPLVIKDDSGDFTVTAFDANHCPGAVMFLFEGKFGNILHTGDCRLTPDCVQNLPLKYIGKKGIPPKCHLDCIFLDCTFGKFRVHMPSGKSAIQQVVNCIWEHPEAREVYLACDLLGQEEILMEVAKVFGEKIYVDRTTNLKCFKTLQVLASGIVSDDIGSRFQLLGFPNLYGIAKTKIDEALANFEPEPLIIRPSSQWYCWDEGTSETVKLQKERIDRAVRDVYGVWHVCYSIHSSRDELEWGLELLAPKWVVSTTPPCRAMDLDYFKKNCFSKPQAMNECVLRLLGIKEVVASQCSDGWSDDSQETECEPVIIQTHTRKRLSLSPPGRRPMVTLFGRARLGVLDEIQTTEVAAKDEKFENKEKKSEFVVETRSEECASNSSVILLNFYSENTKKLERDDAKDADDLKERNSNFAADVVETRHDECASTNSSVILSNLYSENMRKFYRSLNVPVPQRLPSIVKLMNGIKSRRP